MSVGLARASPSTGVTARCRAVTLPEGLAAIGRFWTVGGQCHSTSRSSTVGEIFSSEWTASGSVVSALDRARTTRSVRVVCATSLRARALDRTGDTSTRTSRVIARALFEQAARFVAHRRRHRVQERRDHGQTVDQGIAGVGIRWCAIGAAWFH